MAEEGEATLEGRPDTNRFLQDAVTAFVAGEADLHAMRVLMNMHTLNLESTRCDALRRWLLLVLDLLWNVCLCDQTTGSVMKELRPWVHICGGW